MEDDTHDFVHHFVEPIALADWEVDAEIDDLFDLQEEYMQ